jgi:hypothetical protein
MFDLLIVANEVLQWVALLWAYLCLYDDRIK